MATPASGQGDSLAGPSLPVVVADETTLQASQNGPNGSNENPVPSIPTPSLDSTPQTTPTGPERPGTAGGVHQPVAETEPSPGDPATSPNTEGSVPPVPPVDKRQPTKRSIWNLWTGQEPILWRWWWEIAAAVLSIICICLILVVLLMTNGRALASWPLSIQPNSLIAVFTTAGKASMMVPVASCISQLKWRHFRLRPARLSQLQLLDDASRGPWGSLMLLLHMKANALATAALALVSLVALGIDPSAQQILDFPQREIKLNNVSAEIGVADSYLSKAYKPDPGTTSGSELSSLGGAP